MVYQILVGLSIGATGGFAVYYFFFYRPSRDPANKPADAGWTPTGRIDFAGTVLGMSDSRTGSYTLNAEEQRTIKTASGLDRKEVRWRQANLGEVKKVVKQYHAGVDADKGRPAAP